MLKPYPTKFSLLIFASVLICNSTRRYAGGGTPPPTSHCGNGRVDAGELCLQEPIAIEVGDSTGALDVLAGDLNSDGVDDLTATTKSGDALYLFLSNNE